MVHVKAILFTALVLIAAGLASCTRAAVPLDATQLPQATQIGGYGTPVELIGSGRYSIVFVPEGESLAMHNPAGEAGSVVGDLANDQSGLRRTGNQTQLGSSTWVEILVPGGKRGWIKAWNLTESITAGEFCNDGRVLEKLGHAVAAFDAMDGKALSEVVNPQRGLIVRHDWWNPEILYSPDRVAEIFEDPTPLEWGKLSGSDFEIEGPFVEVISPLLADVLTDEPPAICDQLPAGTTSRPASWPPEYHALHYYAFHREAPRDGNPFDWRTWAFGFEYLDGEPFLTLLVHYHGDI